MLNSPDQLRRKVSLRFRPLCPTFADDLHLYSLQHLGYVIPPQADAGWLGEAGPGPSYLDPGSGGPENDFTNRNTTFMTWNLLHLGRMIQDAGGIPAHGNQRSQWAAGCRFDHPNPLYRYGTDPGSHRTKATSFKS